MADLVSLDEILAAAARLRGVTIRTPLLAFPGASGASGPPALLIKPESLQPTGAFKLRGAYNAIATLLDGARPPGVVAHSSGNHGFAVAYAAARLGVPAAIVVPDNAPPVKTDSDQRRRRGARRGRAHAGGPDRGVRRRSRATGATPRSRRSTTGA